MQYCEDELLARAEECDKRAAARRAKREEKAAAAGEYVVRRRSYCCVHPYPSTMKALRAELIRRGHSRDDIRLLPGYDISLTCLLYTSPSPRDGLLSRMPSSA